ncbi:IDEAL domain-containing protein [Paenibacillus alba]|uniref:IDEAL domain-containing protein n=1 Tax=Paenibacillus alba TaxID=1197127 RepID=A0ABU6G9B2_9BACL|nr:IDEAL domain-containing protein [Paenibacillus alba]MEC0229408.1 IDEAL domain-containing protein [Paenibacillus alba]
MMMNFTISDWVMAATNEDELIHGYVESIDTRQGMARIYVIASDHDAAIGKVIDVVHHDVKKLPIAAFDIEEQVKSLIDVALAARDKEWFMELFEDLIHIKHHVSNRDEHLLVPTTYHNRLGVDQF